MVVMELREKNLRSLILDSSAPHHPSSSVSGIDDKDLVDKESVEVDTPQDQKREVLSS